MNESSEMEIRDKLADLHYDLDRLQRKQLYEAHRTQGRLTAVVVGILALIAVAFIMGAAVGLGGR